MQCLLVVPLAGLLLLAGASGASTSLGPAHVLSTEGVLSDTIRPSCSSDIYCKGELLHVVQMARIYPDSKTFVDKKVRESPEVALKQFEKLMQETGSNPSFEQVQNFVNQTFEDGDELEEWIPSDWTEQPALLERIENRKYREWAHSLNKLWRMLARKMKTDVRDNPSHYSLIYVPHGFVIPGGRFKELYYWDSYWILQGLLFCDMHETAKGVIENLMHLVKVLGFVPNGSRVYYEERSQPPLLIAMARAYYDKTNDIKFIEDNMETLEKEFNFWMNNSMIEVEKDGQKYNLARYFFLSNGPRPESYREDFETTEHLANSTEDRERMYWELKSGAATGWDFSSRWFIDRDGTNKGELKDIKTTSIVPVDLNAFLYGAASSLQFFMTKLNQRNKATGYGRIANELRAAVQAVLWNEEDGIWYDYDALNKKQREYFYGSNLAPLWTNCYDGDKVAHIAEKAVKYIEKTGLLSYRGGTPSSLANTGEQWDFPNCWAPIQALVIQGLDRTGQEDAMNLADELARRWLHANYLGYEQNTMMFEKYDAVNIGRFGGGGEYAVQEGFGWTNGLVFELLAKYNSKGGPTGDVGGVGGQGVGGQDVSNSLSQVVREVVRGAVHGASSLVLGDDAQADKHNHEAHPHHTQGDHNRSG
ncbi:trehalase isoform X2 [Frankliniella occidentalis]|uniref:Trehalase n=1 Tax=Frankliniella occidentalis TaxID=133901 RepID=A0A6J1T5C3_FRAOC|nr:trehalase isoform X2 [Frankliniella occidentalis]